ncbi:MAG: sulfatase-like hydrolase/transferase, partial [Limisphaerales bacterium]
MNLKTTSLALVCALAWLGGLDAAEAKSKTRPNIVFILADDLGWKDLSNEGSKYYESPHIDRIAREGMKFTRGYAACQVCSPSRASIMTGKYPTNHG